MKNSLLLSGDSRSGKERNAASLPSLGSSIWGGRSLALKEDTSVPCCVAILELLHVIDRLHCLSDQAVPLIFKHFEKFMKGFVSSPHQETSWFTRQECYLLHYLVRFFSTKQSKNLEEIDVSLCHKVSLFLPSLTFPGEAYLLEELVSYSIFHPTFFEEDLEVSVQFLSLKVAEYPLVSASGRLLEMKNLQVLKEAIENLPYIRGLYLKHLKSNPKHLQSVCRMKQEFEHVQSVSFNYFFKDPFFTREWIFIPIASGYDSLKKANAHERAEVDIPSINYCLLWLHYLMVVRPAYIKSLPPGDIFVTIACVFLLNDDLFLDSKIQDTLQCVLRRFLTLFSADRLKLEQISKPAPFLTFYQELLQQFEGSSYGDPLFCATVLIPLQQRYPAFFRTLVLTEHSSALCLLGMSLNQILVPLDNYLHPLENDLPLLKSYLQLLQSGLLTRCPLIYTMAVHHLHHYILSTPEKPQAKKLLATVWRYRQKESIAAILLYKNVDVTKGVNVFSALSPERKELLKNLGIIDSDL